MQRGGQTSEGRGRGERAGGGSKEAKTKRECAGVCGVCVLPSAAHSTHPRPPTPAEAWTYVSCVAAPDHDRWASLLGTHTHTTP